MYQYERQPQPNSRRLKLAVCGLLLFGLVAAGVWYSQGLRLLSIQTGSMAPLIQPGDAILVKPVDPNGLRPGDVISFRIGDGTTVTHRIVGFEQGRILTQGDNNRTVDAPVEATAVVGRAQLLFANAGYVINFARSPVGLLTLVYLPALVVTIIELRLLTRHYRPPYRLAAYQRRYQY